MIKSPANPLGLSLGQAYALLSKRSGKQTAALTESISPEESTFIYISPVDKAPHRTTIKTRAIEEGEYIITRLK